MKNILIFVKLIPCVITQKVLNLVKFQFLSRNRIIGFILGRYNLETESKRLLHKEEQFVSGTEVVKYNESIYILTLLFLFVILILTLFNSIFLILILITPIILLLSNELEIYILTNDRIIVVRRAIFEKLLKIQNETSVALDQIVILSYSRAPLNRNAFSYSI